MTLQYCPECGAKLVQHDDTVYQCDNGHPYYNNPHCGASVAFLRRGQILAVKRGVEPFRGKYCLPGGWIQHNEQPEDGARREAWEETGARVGGLELIGAGTVSYSQDLNAVSIIYLALDWEGDIKAHDDAIGLRWFDIDEVDGPDFAWHYDGLRDKLRELSDGA